MATWLEMAGAKLSKSSNGVEWKVNVGETSSDDALVAEVGIAKRMHGHVHGQIMQCLMKIEGFFDKAREIAASEPKKVIHCVKVGIALSLVSLLYYMRPLYDGVGGNAMWAVMTVVVALEYSVGATIAKSFNRVGATFLAGSIGLGVHWIANQCGHELEPLVLQLSVFIVASVVTFSRFIPSVKARFDYGAMIFILTFSFVSMSGYRVDKLLDLARNRVSTIAIGTSICILTSMFFYPVWAGKDLHDLIHQNLEKLADSLDGCVTDYFDNRESFDGKEEGYKCVLNSKATEVAKANLARWEPAHGPFKYGHPWKQYLKIGASMRTCAYCIETLRGYISSEGSGMQVPELLKEHMKQVCMTLSSSSSEVLRELAITMESMRKSTKTDILVHEMNFAVETFQNVLKDLSNQAVVLVPTTVSNEEDSRNCKLGEKPKPEPEIVPIMEIFPVATMASLLIEIAERVEGIVAQVEEMAEEAKFDNFVVINKKNNKGIKPSKFDQDHHHHVDAIVTSFQWATPTQYRLAL